jgi:hypothetical protein
MQKKRSSPLRAGGSGQRAAEASARTGRHRWISGPGLSGDRDGIGPGRRRRRLDRRRGIRPDQVEQHETEHGLCYRSPFDPEREAIQVVLAAPSIERGVRELIGPSTVEDEVAVALVELLRTSGGEAGVRYYLSLYLVTEGVRSEMASTTTCTS